MKKYIAYIMLIFVSQMTFAQTDDLFVVPEFEYAEADTIQADTLDCDTVADDSTLTILEWPQNVQARIDNLLEHDMFNTSQVGLMVYDLTADSAIYMHNEQQTMRPASTMKAITAIAAIDKLGGSYQFRTFLFYTGTVDNNTLNGDVYCVGGFDPRFNSDDLRAFVESLLRMGVDTIRGNIVADKSMKEEDMLGEGWCWDDDNPVLSPLLLSRKDDFVDKFITELTDAGVVVDAYRTEGALPNGAFILCTRFHSLDQILMRMMKESDNLYAESMFYQLAAASGHHPASAEHARESIKRLISKVGLNPSRYRIADGSGLSLYNYVSAELEVALLRYAYQNSNIFLHLYPSLPVAGQDGTLKRRMRGSFTSGNVHAKTGTLTGISSLAGYCTAANGHFLCFSIINQGVMRDRNGRVFQDKVCNALCRP